MHTAFSYTLDREPPLDINVEGYYEKGWKLRPAEPGTFVIESVTDETGAEIETSEAEDAAIIEYALDNQDW